MRKGWACGRNVGGRRGEGEELRGEGGERVTVDERGG